MTVATGRRLFLISLGRKGPFSWSPPGPHRPHVCARPCLIPVAQGAPRRLCFCHVSNLSEKPSRVDTSIMKSKPSNESPLCLQHVSQPATCLFLLRIFPPLSRFIVQEKRLELNNLIQVLAEARGSRGSLPIQRRRFKNLRKLKTLCRNGQRGWPTTTHVASSGRSDGGCEFVFLFEIFTGRSGHRGVLA